MRQALRLSGRGPYRQSASARSTRPHWSPPGIWGGRSAIGAAPRSAASRSPAPGGEEQQVASPARPGTGPSTLPRPAASWENLPGLCLQLREKARRPASAPLAGRQAARAPAVLGGSFLRVFLMCLFVTALRSEGEADVSCKAVPEDEVICRETFTERVLEPPRVTHSRQNASRETNCFLSVQLSGRRGTTSRSRPRGPPRRDQLFFF